MNVVGIYEKVGTILAVVKNGTLTVEEGQEQFKALLPEAAKAGLTLTVPSQDELTALFNTSGYGYETSYEPSMQC